MKDSYVWVCGWDRFQHYSSRNPSWIKFYTELLHDDSYLDLSTHRRAVLHGVWIAFATARRRLSADHIKIGRRLGCRVSTADMKALNDAGFIDFVASGALAGCERKYAKALASRAPAPSQEEDKEVDREKKRKPSAVPTESKDATNSTGDNFTPPTLRDAA